MKVPEKLVDRSLFGPDRFSVLSDSDKVTSILSVPIRTVFSPYLSLIVVEIYWRSRREIPCTRQVQHKHCESFQKVGDQKKERS